VSPVNDDKTDDVQAKLTEIDGRLRELEAMQQLMLRILSTTKPLGRLLEQYGATDTQERAFYHMLDELVTRVRGRESDRPTFGYFELQLGAIFPTLRQDHEFVQLIIDTLKVERPAYRELYKYATAQGWRPLQAT
jgi:hypothetical protein